MGGALPENSSLQAHISKAGSQNAIAEQPDRMQGGAHLRFFVPDSHSETHEGAHLGFFVPRSMSSASSLRRW